MGWMQYLTQCTTQWSNYVLNYFFHLPIGSQTKVGKPLKPNIANTSLNYQKLEKHTQEFNEPKIISVCSGRVHVAIGYGLANAILIEGDSGLHKSSALTTSFLLKFEI